MAAIKQNASDLALYLEPLIIRPSPPITTHCEVYNTQNLLYFGVYIHLSEKYFFINVIFNCNLFVIISVFIVKNATSQSFTE